ncbi:protein singed wings 2 [Anoplophora glabripennis]|uniref:protein singed wings 2 n=1 Tax=Anoplophora glabripennis TaxID=217634 RepID=UPI000874D1A3|nr:protein singed wings 2 [Anoplophora glabripennis]
MMFVIYWLIFLRILHGSMTSARTTQYCTFQKDKLKCHEHLPNIPYPSNITVLELSDLNWEILDLNNIANKFPNLQRLSVIGRNIVRVVPPENETSIKVLELRRLTITNISSTLLSNFPSIEDLILEGNHLYSLDKNFYLGPLQRIYLKHNKWKCSEDLEWVLNLNRTIVQDIDELVCHGIPHSGKPLFPIAQYLKDIKDQCTEKCNCLLAHVVRDPKSDLLEPIILVNCSYRDLTELPSKLPHKTNILHLEGNSIENLKPLKTNPAYRSLMDLYLDNNKVNSIGVLEGSHWLTHLRAFSLKGNKLIKLPVYALDNALEKNINMPNAVRILFGGNPWRCDCVFVPVFQEMLQKYAPQIKDINDIRCAYVEGDENSLLPIAELSRSSVCKYPTEYSVQEALDLLNAVLACLILFILGKLAYDYYHFKRSGRLPWIVTKMP